MKLTELKKVIKEVATSEIKKLREDNSSWTQPTPLHEPKHEFGDENEPEPTKETLKLKYRTPDVYWTYTILSRAVPSFTLAKKVIDKFITDHFDQGDYPGILYGLKGKSYRDKSLMLRALYNHMQKERYSLTTVGTRNDINQMRNRFIVQIILEPVGEASVQGFPKKLKSAEIAR